MPKNPTLQIIDLNTSGLENEAEEEVLGLPCAAQVESDKGFDE